LRRKYEQWIKGALPGSREYYGLPLLTRASRKDGHMEACACPAVVFGKDGDDIEEGSLD